MSKRLYLLLFFLSTYQIGLRSQTISYPKYNIDSIINITLRDSIGQDSIYKGMQADYCEWLKKVDNKIEFMFPYHEFNKVLLCKMDGNDRRLMYDQKDYFAKLDQKFISKGTKLSKQQIEKLLVIINNPLNYGWSECGSPTPEYEFVFMDQQNIIVNRFVVCCNMNQIITAQNSEGWIRMKYGDFFKGEAALENLIKQVKK